MTSNSQRRFSLTEVYEITGVDRPTLTAFVQREWIYPAGEEEFDQEDVARVRLIQELRDNFGANDEAIPLILHLMDQLYYLRHQVREAGRMKR